MAPRADTFVGLLRGHAAARPDDRALTFLAISSRGTDTPMSYAELDRRARAIAATLQARSQPGDRAVLLFQPGLDYVTAFFGCLYAGVIAVPAYPPQGHRQLPRLEAIVADATPSLALTTSETLRRGGSAFEALGREAGLGFLAIDTIPDDAASDWRQLPAGSDDVAFLQYTSGSTGTPKGAMMRHGNLMHNSAAIHRAFGHGPGSVSLLWVPPYHDMGLIGGILQPLYGGFPGVLMSPLAFFKHPLGWLQAIDRLGATTSGGPNFAYELCARRARPEDLEGLDLSRWTLAFNGAEPVRAETMRRFAEVFAPCGFSPEALYPCYGLAESTLIVTGGRARTVASPADGAPLVTSGHTASDMTVRVVDPETHTLRLAGEVGEVWVAGPSVAAGSWGRPDATASAF
ncbi:MAG: fatty acyl-AMP ligase, partial [Candidatus Sericytochromatia bacterium]